MIEEKSLVSVVVPTYNQEEFIAETLNSIINQSYKKLEIIISDDCSTDKTIEIIKEFSARDSRIKAFFSKENKGIPFNFNRAFDNCRGEFVAFFSGDDIMYEAKIEKQVQFLNENTNCDLVMHQVDIFESETNKVLSTHQNTGELSIPKSPVEWLFPTKWMFLKKYTAILPTSILARSSYYLQARYDERFKYKHELLFHLENYMNKPTSKWEVIPETLGRYRVHKNNFTNNTKLSKVRDQEKFLIHAIVLEKYPSLIKKSKNFIHFTMFENLLFFNIQERNKGYLKQFYHEAGLLKFSYLLICKFLNHLKILFPIFKIIRLVLRIK